MQFTKAEGYGILGMLYLAEHGRDRIIPLSEIAEIQEVPEKFLAKIFQNLTRTGIIRSHRGIKGGFSLGKDAESITIRRIVEAIQGPYHLVKCIDDYSYCDKWEFCPVRVILKKAEKKILEIFDGYTLVDLLKWKRRKPAEPVRGLDTLPK
jgi:Rrf2 family protein